jgi:hypothetical protein
MHVRGIKIRLLHLESVVQAWSLWLAEDMDALEKIEREVNMVLGLRRAIQAEKLEDP